MDYGSQIMTIIFHYALKAELYEDCEIIKNLFAKYHLDIEQSMEDYQAEFWRMGFSGRTAIANMNEYLASALDMVGYPTDAVQVPQYNAI